MRLFRNPNIKDVRGRDVKCDECGTTNIPDEAWEFDFENYNCPEDVVPFTLCFPCVRKMVVAATDAIVAETDRLFPSGAIIRKAYEKRPRKHNRPIDLDRALAAEDYGDPDDVERNF